MTKEEAVHAFFSRFGKFYNETAIPTGDEKPDYPYGTYEGTSGAFGEVLPMSVSWYDRTTSMARVNAKAAEIASAVGRGRISLPCDGGAVQICRGEPFVRDSLDTPDPMIKRKIFNFYVEYITEV